MIQEDTHHDTEIRRFLLGEMPEEERVVFEERFVADADLFERISVGEDELIESYARGTLDSPTRAKFEKYFLATEKRRARVRFARAMLDKLPEYRENNAAKKIGTADIRPSFWDSMTIFFKNPIFALGTAFVILIAAFGGWFLLKNSNKREIARQTTPTPTAAANEKNQPAANQSAAPNQNGTLNSNLPEKNGTNKNGSGQKTEMPDKNSNIQSRTIVNPVLALFAGTVRSEGKTKELTLPPNAGNVSLQLNLESNDYKIYQAEIVTPDGEIVLKRVNLAARNSKISFSVPAQKLRRGDYLVKLSALNPKKEIESVADYSFRVNR